MAEEVIGSSALPPVRSIPNRHRNTPIFWPHPPVSLRKPRSTTWDSSMGRYSTGVTKSRSMDDFADSPQERMGESSSAESGSEDIKETAGDVYLDSAHEEKLEDESDRCPSAEGDGSTTKIQADESNGDPRSITRADTGTVKPGKVVTFSFNQDFAEPDEDSRQSLSAKLSAIPPWDTCGDDEEIFRATSHETGQNNRSPIIHFRQSPEPTTWAKMNPFRDMSWSFIGSCIVRTAPCFWCSKKLGISPTDREILLRLNRLCFFFCVVQLIAGIFLFVINFIGYYEDVNEGPFIAGILWSLQLFVYCISVVSAVLGVWSLFAQRILREVNLVGSGA